MILSEKNIELAHCPLARGLEFVGDAWSMLILRDAFAGVTRFDQFRKNLDIAPTMLTRRLAALTKDGLLRKQLYSERPPREEYVLTDAGRDFLPVLMMLGAWAHRNCGGELARYVDAETGQEIEPVGVDAATGVTLGDRPYRMALGAG
jgi:DNA-binding HxlR family transcriptional regulator